MPHVLDGLELDDVLQRKEWLDQSAKSVEKLVLWANGYSFIHFIITP